MENLITRRLNTFQCGDARRILATFPDECVDAVVTSPPYYGQRDYGEDGQIGNEKTWAEYLEKLVCTFVEVRRILKPQGTLWLNIGDKYAENRLLGLPWRLAIALSDQAQLILRSDIIWHKPNAMPSSVSNRPTTDHEYIFMFAKSASYYYDADAIREPHVTFSSQSKMRGGRNHLGKANGTPEKGKNKGNPNLHRGRWDQAFHPNGRNKRTVWSIPLSKFPDAHFAVFPEILVRNCVLASSKSGGIILDPFMGSGTTAVVCKSLQRNFIGIDCSDKYCQMAAKRVARVEPLLLV